MLGSILGPLLFLIDVVDIKEGIISNIKLFANDTSLVKQIDDISDCFQTLNSDLDKLNTWSQQWCVTFNAQKTKYLLISKKKNIPHYPALIFNNVNIKRVTHYEHLGLILNDKLSWTDHIADICKKCHSKLNTILRMRHLLPRLCIEKLYKTFVRSLLYYVDVTYDSANSKHVQRRACIISSGAIRVKKHVTLLKEVGLNFLKHAVKLKNLHACTKLKIIMFQIISVIFIHYPSIT